MKLIKYTLTPEGTIPEYVVDGGYLAVSKGGATPQDDDAPQVGFANKAALTTYVESKGFEFKDPITEEIIPISNIVDNLWAKLG